MILPLVKICFILPYHVLYCIFYNMLYCSLSKDVWKPKLRVTDFRKVKKVNHHHHHITTSPCIYIYVSYSYYYCYCHSQYAFSYHYHPLSLSLSRVLLFYFRIHTYALSPIRWWSDPIRLARRRSGAAQNCQALRKWWLLGQAQLLEMEPMEPMEPMKSIRCQCIRYSWCETQKSSALQHAPGCFVDSVH